MNLKEVLKFADDLVFAKTGEHLDNLQEAILRGTLQGEKYTKIAEESHCNESYARDVGSKLWQILSEQLGEEVSKTNFRSAMERFQNSNVLNFAYNVGSFNTCGEARHPSDTLSNTHEANPRETSISREDLIEMPETSVFYDRALELDTLTTWILQQPTHLIALTGIAGIGKTTLAAQLVRQIKGEFDSVIWYNLNESYNLEKLQHRLIQFLSQLDNPDTSASNNKLLSLIQYLQKYRCLVILDDIHSLLGCGELAGKYKPDREDYRLFFKQIETLIHQSCFLLVGWEQPREVAPLNCKKNATRTLKLAGLSIAAGREILRDYGLEPIEYWEKLVPHYQGNPLYLKSVATQILELGEDVTNLLPDETILLPEDLKDILQQQWECLSKIEQQVLLWFAKESQPVSLAILLEKTSLPSSDLLNALQSLGRRGILEKQESLYVLPLVFRKYLNLH